MTEERAIGHTGEPLRHPWPDDCYVQGGRRGLVLDGAGRHYRTAFVEAFPRNPNTFIRGEGATVADAETNCWTKFLAVRDCADGTGQHGPYEPRSYRNGSGFCTKCGAWFAGVLPELPEEPGQKRSLLERALVGDDEALGEIATAIVETDGGASAAED